MDFALEGAMVVNGPPGRNCPTDLSSEERARQEAPVHLALLNLESALGRARGEKGVCESAVSLIAGLFEGARGYVWKWDEKGEHIRPMAAPSELPEELKKRFFNPATPFENREIFRKAIELRHTLMVANAAEDPNIRDVGVIEPGIRSLILIPLMSGDTPLGLVCVCRSQAGVFSEHEVTLANSAANRIGMALAGEQARDMVVTQLKRMSLLNQIARAIRERLDLNSILQIVLIQLEEHLPVDGAAALLYDPKEEVLTVSASRDKNAPSGLALGIAPGTRLPVDQVGLRDCLQGKLIYVPDTTELPSLQLLARFGKLSVIAIPLVAGETVIGILTALRRERNGFDSEEMGFLQQLSEHVALAMHQAQLLATLKNAYEELRQSQLAMLQQERLKALGQMASGIAHDINNSLSPITVYSSLLLDQEPDLSDRAREYLMHIETAAHDISHTVAGMRGFYRPLEAEEVLPVQLNSLLKQAIDLTRPFWRDIPQAKGLTTDMRTNLQQNLPMVDGIESELREALTNLIINAVHALPSGGTITLWTYTEPRRETAEGSSDHVILSVTDTGIGMSEETLRRCTEPFYSTKGELGTGLGLSMVHGIAQRHGAQLEIESTPGKGSTFRMVFPIRAKASRLQARPRSPIQSEGPSLRILHIDDEPGLRNLLREVLVRDGHRVTAVAGGKEGIEAFLAGKGRGQPFDVVITDLGMPGMDGREVAKAIKRESPHTPVLLMTGWGESFDSEGELPPAVDRVLSKPPDLTVLRDILSRLTRGS